MSNQDDHGQSPEKRLSPSDDGRKRWDGTRHRAAPAFKIYAQAKNFMNSPRSSKAMKNPTALTALDLNELPLTPKGRATLTAHNRRHFFDSTGHILSSPSSNPRTSEAVSPQEEPHITKRDNQASMDPEKTPMQPRHPRLARSVSLDVEFSVKDLHKRCLTPRAPSSPNFASPRRTRIHMKQRTVGDSNNMAESRDLVSPELGSLQRQSSGREIRLKHVKPARRDSDRVRESSMTPRAPMDPQVAEEMSTPSPPSDHSNQTSTGDTSLRYQFALWKNVPKRQVSSDALIFPSDSEGKVADKMEGLRVHCESQGTEIDFDLGSVSPIELQQSMSPTSLSDRKKIRQAFQESYQPPPFPWKCGELIGEGTFGKVFMGLNNVTGELFAVKQIDIPWDRNGTKKIRLCKLEEEISLMKDLDHKHIVRYCGTDRNNESFFIFMEYVPGGSIASMLSQFGVLNEDLIRLYTRQILEGIQYLHSKGIVHRDIKGANVLVNEQGVAKLADFGCSKQLHTVKTTSLEESLKSIRGSVPWMAPEVIKQTGHGFKADIWSVGSTVIEMASAKHPWPAFTNNFTVMYSIATTTTSPPVPDNLSDTAKSFLDRCFCIDPEERASAAELLEHPFLKTS